MKPDAMNHAIAEAMPPNLLHFENGTPMLHLGGDRFMPFRPASDLNACAEMEKVLNAGGWLEYHRLLWLAVCKGKNPRFKWLILRATAPQRCEAFLRTLGLWKETP